MPTPEQLNQHRKSLANIETLADPESNPLTNPNNTTSTNNHPSNNNNNLSPHNENKPMKNSINPAKTKNCKLNFSQQIFSLFKCHKLSAMLVILLFLLICNQIYDVSGKRFTKNIVSNFNEFVNTKNLNQYNFNKNKFDYDNGGYFGWGGVFRHVIVCMTLSYRPIDIL